MPIEPYDDIVARDEMEDDDGWVRNLCLVFVFTLAMVVLAAVCGSPGIGPSGR